MPFSISRVVVKEILYGAEQTRFTQDSGIMPEVWIRFAAEPNDKQDLIITPYKERTAAEFAQKLAHLLPPGRDRGLAYAEGRAVVRLSFQELILYVLPLSIWWQEVRDKKFKSDLRESINRILQKEGNPAEINPLARTVLLVGLIHYASTSKRKRILNSLSNLRLSAQKLLSSAQELLDKQPQNGLERLAWMVTSNRKVELALEVSVPSIKGDAVARLFEVDCRNIAWAVLDSGIDSTHAAFSDENGNSRVRMVYDFSEFRELISESISSTHQNRQRLAREWSEKCCRKRTETRELIDELTRDYDGGRVINWALIEPLVSRPEPEVPVNPHGTHVAGILGAKWDESDMLGVCPDIQLYDFRVLGESVVNTEFAVLAALQFIRYLNGRNDYATIHGANLSLSIPHDVSNFACGRTPVCEECIRLVSNGVVVVAAAGNHGYQEFETRNGIYKGYSAFSITDPGNADDVITVGSTHRQKPHTYGISYFSSRGPTGDGRSKPDIVAPGEKIRGPFPNNEEGVLDGTSMSAPHVSGVAAILLARYTELIGQPARIKEILCSTATDLGRERNFQGAGLVDALRAMQSV
jgi:hypothetical protein